MASPLTNRRRAERFSQLLDEANGGRRQHLRTSYDDEVGDLVALQRQLIEECRAPELDHEFRTGLRAMLVATAQREGIGATAGSESSDPAPASRPTPTHALAGAAAARLRTAFAQGPRARTAVIAGITIGAIAFTGMSTASENALPGDALYGVKRSTERAQLALASSDLGRGQLYLEFAQTRLAEAQTLASDLSRVLGDMDRDTSHGVRLLTTAATNRRDQAALGAIESFSSSQRAALGNLVGQVNRAEREPIISSLELLDQIDERVDDLRDNLNRDCTAVSTIDLLGPVPADCVALPAPTVVTHPDTNAAAPSSPDHPAPNQTQTAPATPTTSAEPDATTPQDSTPDATGSATESAPPSSASPAASAAPHDPATTPSDDEESLARSVNRLLGNLLGR